MRKLLMIAIIVLLIVLGIVSVTRGMQIAGLKILSVSQIDEQNTNLDKKIEEVNTLIDTDYPKKLSELKTASKNLEDAKEEYLRYTNLSTSEEILSAMQQKSYKIEFLWTRLGTHARRQGVVLKFEIVSSSLGANTANDIRFTVDGTYVAITNFVYAIENDPELNFRIENFKLLPYTSEIILEATFTVRNITVEGNTSSQSVNQTGTTNKDDTATSTKTNTSTNDNTNTQATNTTTDDRQNSVINPIIQPDLPKAQDVIDSEIN